MWPNPQETADLVTFTDEILKRKLHFLYSEMDMQREYIWTSRTSNAQFSYVFFGFNACRDSSQITPYYLKLHFVVSVFLYVPPTFQKYLFLEHLCTMTSVSSIKNDSIAATPDSFKDCILACKINNQVHTNFEKRKVPQAASGNFVQKWLLCKTYVLCNIFFFVCGQNSTTQKQMQRQI